MAAAPAPAHPIRPQENRAYQSRRIRPQENRANRSHRIRPQENRAHRSRRIRPQENWAYRSRRIRPQAHRAHRSRRIRPQENRAYRSRRIRPQAHRAHRSNRLRSQGYRAHHSYNGSAAPRAAASRRGHRPSCRPSSEDNDPSSFHLYHALSVCVRSCCAACPARQPTQRRMPGEHRRTSTVCARPLPRAPPGNARGHVRLPPRFANHHAPPPDLPPLRFTVTLHAHLPHPICPPTRPAASSPSPPSRQQQKRSPAPKSRTSDPISHLTCTKHPAPGGSTHDPSGSAYAKTLSARQTAANTSPLPLTPPLPPQAPYPSPARRASSTRRAGNTPHTSPR